MDIKENPSLSQNKCVHPWENTRLHIIKQILSNYSCLNQDYLLDFGSGDCFVLSNISKHFKDLQFIGIDPNYKQHHINHLEKLLDRTQIHSDISSITLANKKQINIILLLDVLEHIKDPLRELSNIYYHNDVADDAIFIITVPAFQFLMTKHDIRLGHYCRYDLKSIKNLVKDLNLNILESGYLFQTGFFIRMIEKIGEIFFDYDNSDKINKYKNNTMKNKIFFNLLIKEYNFFWSLSEKYKLHFPGLTACIICQK